MDIEKIISDRAKSIELSPIRKFFNLISKVPGSISLTIGEPDFNTPQNIKEAGIGAIRENNTKYTHNQGNILLRQEISKYLNRQFNLCYDSESEITVTIGAGQAIDTAIRTLVNESDEVLIPSPGYVAYESCVKLSGGRPVFVPTFFEDGFKLKASEIEKYIKPDIKLLILSYPCNPTGASLDLDELTEISRIVKENDLVVISDEVYSELTYGKKHASIASLDGMKERTIVINGFSKTYSMTGWRLGYIAAPENIMKHMVKVHQYNVTCAPSISQIAGIEALKNSDNAIEEMVGIYNERRIYCYERLKNMGLRCVEPRGAFYIFPDIREFGMSSEEFSQKLLYDCKLAVVPGSGFGKYGEGFIRISYACSMDTLCEGLNRLERFLYTLK
jgi:Aspartate/tyrosine/aromatic aminotransferase